MQKKKTGDELTEFIRAKRWSRIEPVKGEMLVGFHGRLPRRLVLSRIEAQEKQNT